MSTVAPLGRLESVPLREAWLSEAQHFTPWLASDENLKLLSEAIGISLALGETEKAVGDFRADIICREVETNRVVLVENQVEKSDHRHFGQILTYAAGSDAVVVVWIVSELREEHRAALEWLNNITRDDFCFFGIEIELWRIGNSSPAPRFNVVVEPNEWRRAVTKRVDRAQSDEPEGIDLNRFKYWEAFGERLLATGGPLVPKKRPPRQGWYDFRLANNAYLYAFRDVAKCEIGVGIGIQGPDGAMVFQSLLNERANLEAEVGEPLIWRERRGSRTFQIAVRLASADVWVVTDWPRQHEWLIKMLERFHTAFRPALERLDTEGSAS
jgi:hypothetical protein